MSDLDVHFKWDNYSRYTIERMNNPPDYIMPKGYWPDIEPKSQPDIQYLDSRGKLISLHPVTITKRYDHNGDPI